MTTDKQMELFDKLIDQERTILNKKGADYAQVADVLSNFKLVGSVTGQKPDAVCNQMIATKIIRLSNLLGSNRAPMNESIVDTLQDLRNYAFLLICILTEQSDNSKKLQLTEADPAKILPTGVISPAGRIIPTSGERELELR